MEKILFLGATIRERGRNFALANWWLVLRGLAVVIVGWLRLCQKNVAKKTMQKFVEKFDFWIFELWRDQPERVAAIPALGLKSQLAAGRENIFVIFGEIEGEVQRGFGQGKLSSDLELPAIRKFSDAAQQKSRAAKIRGKIFGLVVVLGAGFGLWRFL